MKIIYASYVDHQKEIKYPLNFIISKIPSLIVYCSDENNRVLLESQDIKAKIIGVKINKPADIAAAQNACITDIFNTLTPDFVVWSQADIHITQNGHEIINHFCIEENKDKTIALTLTMLKLFHLCGSCYFGVNIIGRNAWKNTKYTEDGAYLGIGSNAFQSNKDSSIDIGYLTIEQCRNHLRQHKKTWQSNDDICEKNDEEFSQAFITRHNVDGLIKEDSEYFKLVKEMNLIKEFNIIKKLINTI